MTLGLAVITNNLKEVTELIEAYYDFFDKLYITVADKDKKVFNALSKDKKDKVELSYFKWINHFGKARLFNQSQIKTDYWVWIDDDDEITNPENLKAIVQNMELNKIDIEFMNYDYYRNELGEQQANHWRERIIRTDSECKWEDVPCHETVPSKGVADRTDLCSVKHQKSVDQMLKSMDRNQILLEEDWKTNKDPRTAYYLGMTYAYHQEHDKALKKYLFMVEKGGWDEQKVIAWNMIADCYIYKGELDKALEACDKAIGLDPTHPDAYYHKVLIYTTLKQYDKAAEWAEMALTKKVNEDSMQLIDPTKYTYRGLFLAAQANLFLGKPDRAMELYSQIEAIAPHFLQQMSSETGINWPMTFTEGYNEQNAISATKFLVSYLKERGGKIDKLFEALSPKLSFDPRLIPERVIAIPPKKWSKKSIAIYCGQGLEPWGPDTLVNGMGGSEEAVIYLTRELAKLGWNITVFCERDSEYIDMCTDKVGNNMTTVTFKPWSEFNPYDEFDVFIAWRRPEFLQGVKAHKKIVDLHDTMPEEALLSVLGQVDQFMVKSDYHRSLYPKIPDDKITIVTNGIYKDLDYAV